jgi:hypothetical protein
MDPTDKITESTIEHWDRLLEAQLGLAGATLVWTVVSVAAVVLGLVFWRYVGVLGSGAAEGGSQERRAYDDLRAVLSKGGSPARIYGRLLTAFLNGLDRFLGDHDKANLGIFRHAFGLRGSYPLWTGAALDRCLLLAIAYPIVSVVAIWAISGHAGPAEQSLGLPANVPEWQRGVLAGSLTVTVISLWRSVATLSSRGRPADLLSRQALPWSMLFVLAIAVAVVFAIDARGVVITALIATGAVAIAVTGFRSGFPAGGSGSGAVAVVVGLAVLISIVPVVGATGTLSVAGALALACGDVLRDHAAG